MSVIHFANTFVGKPGNIGVRTAYVLDQLAAKGLDSTCLCRGAVRKIDGVRYIEMGLLGHAPRLMNATRIYIVPRWNHRFADIGLFEWFSARHINNLLNENFYSVAHIWDNCPRLIKHLRERGVKVILDVPAAPRTYGIRLKDEGVVDFLLPDRRLADIELESYWASDHLIAPSKFVQEELVRAGIPSEKITVINYGVNTSRISSMGKCTASLTRNDGLAFCFVGTINKSKGIPELLEAWDDRCFAYDHLHLFGRVYSQVRNALARVKCGNLTTHGFVNIWEYLPRCDVFVFPSWSEGSAKAIFEAMACGLPAIVTHSSGSIVRDGIDGFVVKAGDIKALREKMQWFKDNRHMIRIMGDKAREHAKAFPWDRYARRVLETYGQQGETSCG